MANVGEQITFRVSLYDKVGALGDPTLIKGRVLLPKGDFKDLTFTRQSLGIFVSDYLTVEDGDHWLRVETTGPIQTAIEKKFEVAEQRVFIT